MFVNEASTKNVRVFYKKFVDEIDLHKVSSLLNRNKDIAPGELVKDARWAWVKIIFYGTTLCRHRMTPTNRF